MATTLVGIFDDFSQAQNAVQQLTAAGIERSAISIAQNDGGKGYKTYGGANATDFETGRSITGSIADFFDSTFGTDLDEDERGVYSEAVRRGASIVTVDVNDDQLVDRAADILDGSGVVNADQRTAQYRASGYEKFDRQAPLYNDEQTQTERRSYAEQGEVALPVIEEQLAVGKRVVQRGGVRIHSRVTERPVEESVNLREENVTVERHAVDRAVTDADFAAIKEGEFTITEKAEVPVVSKEAHVVEEVVVGKNVTERTETVRDSVKRTDVDVVETDTNDATNQTRKANS